LTNQNQKYLNCETNEGNKDFNLITGFLLVS